jgi:hypothetical protein
MPDMRDASKLFDTIIKAPLWFYFAAVMLFGIPMLNLDVLTRVGVTDDIKIIGFPLALYALGSLSLFASSAFARSYMAISGVISYVFDWIKWRIKLFALSNDARDLLALVEDDALETFYYDPRDKAVSLLRDRDILSAVLISSSGDGWGKFVLTFPYKTACRRHRPMFRSVLSYSHDDASAQVRATMQKARRAATGRV